MWRRYFSLCSLLFVFSINAHAVLYFDLSEKHGFFDRYFYCYPSESHCVVRLVKKHYKEMVVFNIEESATLKSVDKENVMIQWKRCIESKDDVDSKSAVYLNIDQDILGRLGNEVLYVKNNNISIGRKNKGLYDCSCAIALCFSPATLVDLFCFGCSSSGMSFFTTATLHYCLAGGSLKTLKDSYCRTIAVTLPGERGKEGLFSEKDKERIRATLEDFLQRIEARCPERLCYATQPSLTWTDSGHLVAMVGVRVLNDEKNGLLSALVGCFESELCIPLFSYDKGKDNFELSAGLLQIVTSEPLRLK